MAAIDLRAPFTFHSTGSSEGYTGNNGNVVTLNGPAGIVLLLLAFLSYRCLRWTGIFLVTLALTFHSFASATLPAAASALLRPDACSGLLSPTLGALPLAACGALAATIAGLSLLASGAHLGRAARCRCSLRAAVVALCLVAPLLSGGFLAQPPRQSLYALWNMERAWDAAMNAGSSSSNGNGGDGGWVARLVAMMLALRGDVRMAGGAWEEANDGCVRFFEGCVGALRVVHFMLLLEGVRRGVVEEWKAKRP